VRKRRPRPIHPLPDLYWISSEQLRLACGRSSYLWQKIDLPVFLEYFPPDTLGADLPADYRWRIDDIAVRMPHLTTHLNGSFLDRFKKKQREEREAYLQSKKPHEVAA
jgi:hypothetical protein